MVSESEGLMDTAYEADFVAWTEHQADLLRAHRSKLEPLGLDVENLVNEVEALASKDRRELRSRLEELLLHLLKWRYQPERQSSSWNDSILQQRYQLADLLATSPSLRRTLDGAVKDVYPRSRRRAAVQTHKPLDTFPADCPWTIAEVLDEDFLP